MKKITNNQEKPIYSYNSLDSPPFYDPNDLHVHIWIKGNLLKNEDPKSPYYSNELLSTIECVYCKICHQIKNQFINKMSNNVDIVKDEFVLKNKEKTYKFLNNNKIKKEIKLLNYEKEQNNLKKENKQTGVLFFKEKEIETEFVKFRNY